MLQALNRRRWDVVSHIAKEGVCDVTRDFARASAIAHHETSCAIDLMKLGIEDLSLAAYLQLALKRWDFDFIWRVISDVRKGRRVFKLLFSLVRLTKDPCQEEEEEKKKKKRNPGSDDSDGSGGGGDDDDDNDEGTDDDGTDDDDDDDDDDTDDDADHVGDDDGEDEEKEEEDEDDDDGWDQEDKHVTVFWLCEELEGKDKDLLLHVAATQGLWEKVLRVYNGRGIKKRTRQFALHCMLKECDWGFLEEKVVPTLKKHDARRAFLQAARECEFFKAVRIWNADGITDEDLQFFAKMVVIRGGLSSVRKFIATYGKKKTPAQVAAMAVAALEEAVERVVKKGVYFNLSWHWLLESVHPTRIGQVLNTLGWFERQCFRQKMARLERVCYESDEDEDEDERPTALADLLSHSAWLKQYTDFSKSVDYLVKEAVRTNNAGLFVEMVVRERVVSRVRPSFQMAVDAENYDFLLQCCRLERRQSEWEKFGYGRTLMTCTAVVMTFEVGRMLRYIRRQKAEGLLCSDHKEIVQYLDEAVSNPHNLQDLCRFKVSHMISCRPGRLERIMSLDITSAVKDKLLFMDLLSTQ
nr:hypothetical protein BaRGS_000264 [Batillaria attramentaria]